MALLSADIEQIKTIFSEMWEEHQASTSSSYPQKENDRKFELLERIVRVEEELKYLREDMKELGKEDMVQMRKEIKEDMDRQFKLIVWVLSGWGSLRALLATPLPLLL